MSFAHASCVVFGRVGVLIRGPSGAGKSSLCLRLIDAGGHGLAEVFLRAQLVADDQVELACEDGVLFASPATALAGKLEVRGLGIVDLPYQPRARIGLVVDLIPLQDIERLPEARHLQAHVEGVALPRLALAAEDPAAPAKLRAALSHFALV